MTVALAAQAPSSFEIKSARVPALTLQLRSGDLALLDQEFDQRFGAIPDFFDDEPVVIDLAPLQAPPSEAADPDGSDGAPDAPEADDAVPDVCVDFVALCALLRRYRLQPWAVYGGSASQTAAAVAAGLQAPGGLAPIFQRSEPTPTPSEASIEPAPDPTAGLPEPLVIDRMVRSGQRVYARGRDLIVLGTVNPGAEVIADGSIHVYAALRGKAIAGARGNPQARVFALGLSPELISIAGIYRTSEVPLPGGLDGQPAQVWLDSSGGAGQERLVIQALTS
ncbi:septum site-determining protein MinC [Amphibiibacter pelophylacis]|uniref:Septum site-determining protein MinC n=1 Tax=Amphibiibacter pelophylacis TaxID=1799477 RepID=A0ACC6P3B4_9BURK